MKKRYILSGLLSLNLLLFSGVVSAQDVRLDVPSYMQGKDAPWADEILGTDSSVTIRTHGCALTCISMVVSYFRGEEVNPSEMNLWLKDHDGYESGLTDGRYLGEVVLRWPALTGLDDGWVYTRFDWEALPADLVLIRYYLDKSVPVIAEVLYNRSPHYVVLTGYGAEGFLMNDPEFPDQHVLNRVYNISDIWGSGPARNIYGIRVLYPGVFVIP